MKHSESDSHSVVRRSSSSEFVENNERLRSSLLITLLSIHLNAW